MVAVTVGFIEGASVICHVRFAAGGFLPCVLFRLSQGCVDAVGDFVGRMVALIVGPIDGACDIRHV